MEKKEVRHPNRDSGFNTGAYSDGIILNCFLFISGQAAVDFKTSKFILGTIEEETSRSLDNIKDIIEAAGSSMKKIVKLLSTCPISLILTVITRFMQNTLPE